MRKTFSILAALLLFASCLKQGTRENSGEELYTIQKFVDGDTFWVDDGSRKGMKIRLIGINAPEPRAYFGREEEPYGKEASRHIVQMIGSSQLRLEFDVDSLDQYGRTLAYAFLEDGTFINKQMVEDGYAQVATYPPNVKYTDVFLLAQQEARREERGLWANEQVQ
jgi:micrococcal nuclease